MTQAGKPYRDMTEEELRTQYVEIGGKYWREDVEEGPDDKRELRALADELRERFGYSDDDLDTFKALSRDGEATTS
jgi:hypothetical protein